VVKVEHAGDGEKLKKEVEEVQEEPSNFYLADETVMVLTDPDRKNRT